MYGYSAAVVRTKLIPPSQREALVARPRLLSRALGYLARRLTVVSGPAGYGKTGLLSQLHQAIEQRGEAVGWFSLEEADNDFVRFVAHLVAALRGPLPHFGQATLALLGSGLSLPSTAIKTTLLNELATLDSDFHLFLDDYHLIEDGAVIDLIRTVLLAPLDHLHLLVATRNPKSLPISRLRATGRLHEIDAFDLEFSDDEAANYFAGNGNVVLAPAQITFLLRRTEGWIAGLQLANLAIGDGEDPEELLDTLSGERRGIGDFLAEEVFRRQSEETRAFLAATSILKRFDAGLCNAVLGRDDSHRLIDQIEQANLFLFALDKERHWFRYHHLFAEFLQRRLREDSPAMVAQLHRRACDALAQTEFLSDAIDHAFAAGDLDRAGRLLDASSNHLFWSGQTATLRAQARRLPDHLLRRLPRLQLELAFEGVIRWEFHAARAAIDNVRETIAELETAEDAETRGLLAVLRSELAHRCMMLSLFTDQLPAAERQARRWLAEHQVGDPFMEASVGSTLIVCNRELHICDITPKLGGDLHRKLLQGRAVYGTVFHDSLVGTAFFAKGELEAAEQVYRQALARGISLHGPRSPLAAMPGLLLAELLYERNRIDEVRELVAAYGAAPPELGFVDNLVAGFVTRARLAFLDEDAKQAEEICHEGRAVALRYGFRRLDIALLCEQARQTMLLRGPEELDQRLIGMHMVDGLAPIRTDEDMTSVDVDLATIVGRMALPPEILPAPLSLHRSLYNHALRRHGIRSALRAATQMAMIASRAGDSRSAQYHLAQALKLSQAHGLVRTLLDEGAALRALLEDFAEDELASDPRLQTQARKLLAMGAEAGHQDNGFDLAWSTTDGPLGIRDLEILRLGLDSRTNDEIARLLGITESTVKWYWQRIYRKLAVRRRSDAIRKAKKLNLI